MTAYRHPVPSQGARRPRRSLPALLVASTGVLAVVLSLLLAGGATGGSGASAALPALQAFDAADFRADVFAEVNDRREAAGEDALLAVDSLQTAAQAHAAYLVANGDSWDASTFDAHNESGDLPGFYAVKPGDRALKAGYLHDRLYEDVLRLQTPGSVIVGSPWSAERLVATWIDAPLHRRAVLDRTLIHGGFGYTSTGEYHGYVLDTAVDHLALSKPSDVQPYPVNGQTGVPTSWDGDESPQPFPGLEYPSGYPITVFPVWGGPTFDDVHLELERAADGAPVEVVTSTVRNVAFAPVEPLEPGTTYKATVSYTMRNIYTGVPQSGGVIWQFTTAGTPPSTTTTTGSSTTTTGSTSTTLMPTTTTVPPTTTTTLAVPVFSDVSSGHLYAEAIAAMASRGVISGYVAPGGERTFRPDDPVKRAQFAKMIVGALGLPVSEGGVACPFGDVEKPTDDLYPDDYVAVAFARGITRGLTADTFGPYQPVTRAQVITMVVRAAGSELPARLVPPPAGFIGVLPSGDPNHGANIRMAEANHLLDGIPLGGWSVYAPATRGEVAQILWNLVR